MSCPSSETDLGLTFPLMDLMRVKTLEEQTETEIVGMECKMNWVKKSMLRI